MDKVIVRKRDYSVSKLRDCSSSSDNSRLSSSSSECTKRKKRKIKKDKKEHKKKEKKKEKKRKKKHKRKKDEESQSVIGPVLPASGCEIENSLPSSSNKTMDMVPMTKEEWEKQQSVVRRVYDPDTGRNRLVKGDGEIIEEIVSYSRHKEINHQATKCDGATFQIRMGLTKQ